jgi:hypothetical protein
MKYWWSCYIKSSRDVNARFVNKTWGNEFIYIMKSPEVGIDYRSMGDGRNKRSSFYQKPIGENLQSFKMEISINDQRIINIETKLSLDYLIEN